MCWWGVRTGGGVWLGFDWSMDGGGDSFGVKVGLLRGSVLG